MSHYIFKKKLLIELDNCILPLALYADSSVTDDTGRRHPAYWGLYNITKLNQLLIPKDEWNKAKKEIIKEEYKRLNDFNIEFNAHSEINENSYCCSGNTYPGGGKIKNYASFLSCRKTVKLEDIKHLTYGYINISVSLGDKYLDLMISDEDSLREANKKFQELAKQRKEKQYLVIGIYGIQGD